MGRNPLTGLNLVQHKRYGVGGLTGSRGRNPLTGLNLVQRDDVIRFDLFRDKHVAIPLRG